jgi:hypothetical protein
MVLSAPAVTHIPLVLLHLPVLWKNNKNNHAYGAQPVFYPNKEYGIICI